MIKKRKSYTAEEKAKIALEALSESRTSSELTSQYSVHSSQIAKWKKHLKLHIADLFRDKRNQDKVEHEALVEELYKEIGRLKVKCEWLKKKSSLFK